VYAEPESPRALPPIAGRLLLALAFAKLLFHALIAGQYGWFRDELYYIDAGKHLSGGYVEFPMMVALFANFQRFAFGHSIAALHVLPALAGAAIVVLTGLMARELGGGRTAQGVAALAALMAPAFLGADSLFTMDAFDELWWTLAAYLLIRILATHDPSRTAKDRSRLDARRLWLLFGLVIGLGLLTKLTILGYGTAVLIGLLLMSAGRAELRTRAPYVAAVLAAAFLIPYIAWQLGHDWATLTFWHNYGHKEDPAIFLIQVFLLMLPTAMPLWAAGLWYLLRAPGGAPYRAFGWIFLFLFVVFLLGHAKSYFLVPAFPPLLAAGAVVLERRSQRRPGTPLVSIAVGALVLGGIVLAPVVAPVLPARTLAALMSSPIQPVADRFGWPQFTATVAAVYRHLPPSEQGQAIILTGNYGETAALDLLGPPYHLPTAISPHNTYYFWGFDTIPKSVVIATGYEHGDLTPYFRSVRQAAIVPAEDGIQNEETGQPVFVCTGLKMPWSNVWPQLKNFS
jgi:4-amino-4-deoxy-L-arabinose transferase-like glycosyltransferase